MSDRQKMKYLIYLGILMLLFFTSLSASLARELWFDEALTLLEFVTMPRAIDIYLNYPIPNNHIVYNLCLRFFSEVYTWFLPLSVLSFRLFSFYQYQGS